MKALRILLVAAMVMMMVPVAFADITMEGEAEYAVTFETVDDGDTDTTNLTLGDGGRISFKGAAEKELDNGATVAVETRLDIKYDEIGKDYIRLKYMNGPLTVQMLKADRPGFMSKGLDKYVPEGPWYNCETTGERDISFAYAGEGMKFVGTLNVMGSNTVAVRPYVEMGLGAATLKAAVEYVTEFPTNTDADGPTKTTMGGGAGVEAGLGAITVGASGAYGIIGGTDDMGDDVEDVNKMSAYAFMKMGVGAGTVGLAGGYNMETADSYDNDKTSVQVNAGFEQGNIIVPGLTVKIGAGFATITDENDNETTKTGGNFKLVYGF